MVVVLSSNLVLIRRTNLTGVGKNPPSLLFILTMRGKIAIVVTLSKCNSKFFLDRKSAMVLSALISVVRRALLVLFWKRRNDLRW